jgi:hypothetical protein
MNFLHDAFISFAWRDLARARRLHEQLTALGYVTWYAEQNLRAGADIPTALWDALERSRYVFIVHSRHHGGAPWAERELSVATSDEVNSRLTKIVFLTFDDTAVPYGMRHKLYIDFRDAKKKPLTQLQRILDEASEGIIRGVASAMSGASDIDAIRSGAARLSAIARLRNEELVIHELRDMLLTPATPRHVSDSAAWAIGDIAVWSISDAFSVPIKETIERCISSGDSRLTAHMAYIAGEMAMAARNVGLRRWADALITAGEMSRDAELQAQFAFTRSRIGSLERSE